MYHLNVNLASQDCAFEEEKDHPPMFNMSLLVSTLLDMPQNRFKVKVADLNSPAQI